VPQGAQLLLAPILVSYGIPAEGVALLIAVDTIPDLFGTMTNVPSSPIIPWLPPSPDFSPGEWHRAARRVIGGVAPTTSDTDPGQPDGDTL